uniref:RNA-directed DNA polymerase n=1 Tax=Fagus sylvatica TaxID=28930 RepID=A0A2N9F9Z4_FAGSY
MPPRSRRQNSVVNSHPDTESNAQNRAEGEMQQNNGGNVGGGGIPEGNQGGGNPGGQPPLTLIYELIQGLQQNQGELAESIRQLKESSNNREAHGGNGRNHEERDHHDERDSNNKNDAPFVTMSDEPYPEKYDTPNFSLFDGRKGSAVEHISKFLDSMGPFAGNGGLCLREFSKSLVDRAYTWYAMLPEGSIRDWEDMVESFCSKYFHVEEKITLLNLHSTKQLPGEDLLKYIHRFRDISLDCHVKYEESELVEVCIDNMLPEFRAHLENLDISQFAPLLQKARKTALSVKPHSEKAREKKSQPQALTVSTTAAPTGNKRKRPTEKMKLSSCRRSTSLPPRKKREIPSSAAITDMFTILTADCRSLRWELNRKIQDGTLQLSPEQQRVHKNPFPNHRKDKGKAVVSVVIQGSTSDMEVEESAVADTTLTPAAVRTLQKSPKFKSLFNQLGLGPEARNAATEAIIAIAADSGATCFTAEAHASRAFLETTNAVTFTDEDMEVQYPDHRRPLYVSAVIKDVQVRRALVDTGSCLNLIPLSTLKAANIPQHKIQGAPIEVTGFGGAAEYTMGHIQLVLRVGPIVALTRFHVVNSEVPYHVLLGRPWLHKHKLISSTYHQCIKGRLNGKPIRIAANPSPFDQTEAHFIEAALYDELSTEEPPIIKPSGTPLPDWEDIRNDPDVDLREVLERKKKRKERMAEEEDAPRCKEAESYKSLADEKEEAKLEEVCGREFKDNSQGRPGERACFINLLKEYQDVFAWKYDEMPGIDPGLVAHSLNVEPGTKPVVQPARTFHTEVEAQITPRSEEIACCRFHQANSTSAVAVKYSTSEEEKWADQVLSLCFPSWMDLAGTTKFRMSPRDAEKTAFRTPIGNFYYTVMPFGLKNAGATYQRTMTAMFHDMIHQEIEDYVDDIVVNVPSECLRGNFWVSLVHNRGIDVDPAKASAIATMRPPTSHKELKELPGKPVYYVSRGLKDTETRYSVAERACLALVYASQRLRHYFLAHKIQLMTKSHPIRSLLQRPVLSGRLAQWLLQLSQYEISTETPTAIKSQAIADLLAQFPGEDGSVISQEVPGEVGGALLVGMADSIWTLNFDGSSTSVSSGAEYEAYITGLAIAHEMGIKHLRVIGDSNLIVCQAKGEFSLKEPSLAPYRALAQKEGTKKLQEVHEKSCELEGGVSLYRRLQRLGYFWPEMSKEAADLQRRCPTCQHQHENEQVCATFLSSDWRTPFLEYFIEGILPRTGKEAARIKKLSTRYFVESGILFRKGFHGDPLRCLSLSESQTVMKEAHSGECGEHQGKEKVVSIAVNTWLLTWPTMKRDTADFVKACHTCQMQANLIHTHPTNLQNMATPWPFHTWGLDLIGPINPPSGGYIWILAATEYFYKIISDNGTPFVNKDVREVLEHYRIKHRRAGIPTWRMCYGLTADHPRQPLVSLHSSLVYGTDVISPPELLVPSPRILQGTELEADVEMCAEARVADLESLDEARELALARSLRYHQKSCEERSAVTIQVHTKLGRALRESAKHMTADTIGLSKADGTILADPINGKWLKEYYS